MDTLTIVHDAPRGGKGVGPRRTGFAPFKAASLAPIVLIGRGRWRFCRRRPILGTRYTSQRLRQCHMSQGTIAKRLIVGFSAVISSP